MVSVHGREGSTLVFPRFLTCVGNKEGLFIAIYILNKTTNGKEWVCSKTRAHAVRNRVAMCGVRVTPWGGGGAEDEPPAPH